MREASFGLIAVKLHHGDQVVAPARAYVDSWRPYRAVVGWGWLQGDPVEEARLAARLCRELGLAGYIANAEFAYEDAGRGKSEAFVREFRRLAPLAPLALSALVASPGNRRTFDYQPWIDAGASFRPQCYEGDPVVYRLPISTCVDYALSVGWKREQVQPDILGNGASNIPADVASLAAADTVGFGLFLGSGPVDDDYRVAGAFIRDRGIAIAA